MCESIPRMSQVSMFCHSVRIFSKVYVPFNVVFGHSSGLSAVFHILFVLRRKHKQVD